jgi:inhibitor of cysteine peptidase
VFYLCGILLLLVWHPNSSFAQADKLTIKVQSIMLTNKQQQFSITLRSIPSSGFSWWLSDYNPQLIQPLQHQTRVNTSKLLGTATEEIWTFLVKNMAFVVPQQTLISFNYARPWRLEQPANQAKFLIAIKQVK